MITYIVLLRGINVGGNNILPMKELVEILEGIGCTNIRTYIQSGNVVVESNKKKDQMCRDIKSEILKVKDIEIDPIVLSLGDFESAVRGNSFNTENGKLLHLFFLSGDSSSPELSVLEKYKSASEEYELKGRVLYLYAPDGIGRSKFITKVQKAMGVPVTARNWNTVQKLISLAGMQKPH